MPAGINEFIWFVVGIISYRIVTTALEHGHMYNLLAEVKDDMLKLLVVLAEDMEYIRQLKYKYLRDASIPVDEIEKIKEVDTRVYRTWKEAIIARMICSWPKLYRRCLKFHNWDTAVRSIKEKNG